MIIYGSRRKATKIKAKANALAASFSTTVMMFFVILTISIRNLKVSDGSIQEIMKFYKRGRDRTEVMNELRQRRSHRNKIDNVRHSEILLLQSIPPNDNNNDNETSRQLSPTRIKAIYTNSTSNNTTIDDERNGIFVNARTNISKHFTILRPNISDVFVNGTKFGKLQKSADQSGPIIDFAIIGFPHCGTKIMGVNLGRIAPMPNNNICTPLNKAVYDSHFVWPNAYDPNNAKPLRGIKCAGIIDTYPLMKAFDRHLRRTKFFVGIQHPILWFQAFYNMQMRDLLDRTMDPYDYIDACNSNKSMNCTGSCTDEHSFCLERTKFHIPLARLGKTPLQDQSELQYLKSHMLKRPKNHRIHVNHHSVMIHNPVFIYEVGQLDDTEKNMTRQETFWMDVVSYLSYPNPTLHDDVTTKRHHIRNNLSDKIMDICDAKYDKLRSLIMPAAYDMSYWICDYFVEVGTNVHVSNKEYFCSIVRSYRDDPCGRLIRLETNGTYIVDHTITIGTNSQ